MTIPTDPATQSPDAPARVAVVGSGPSGCYTAQALRKRVPNVAITVFDSLPTPYGLIRHGIAPDHQGAKAVSRQFDRLFAQDGVDFVGNTTIGRDVPLSAIVDAFDAVVFATGLARDRPLGVPIAPDARVIGAGQLLRLLNSDPDSSLRTAEAIQPLGESIALVGTGNVAVDVARLLSKSREALDASDIDDTAHSALVPRPIGKIHIIGRCDRESAKWDPSMLKELAGLSSVDLRADGEPYGDSVTNGSDATVVDVHFCRIIDSVTAQGSSTRLTTHDSSDATQVHHFDVDCVIAAVGFDEDVDAQADLVDHLGDGIFRVGGSVSGRLGNLAENRKLAGAVAADVADFLARKEERPATSRTVESLLPAQHVTFEQWKQIDAAETRRANPGRCRTKFTTRPELLAAAGTQPTTYGPGTN